MIDYDEAFDGSSVPIAAASATTKGLEAIPLVAGETAESTGSDNSPKRRHDSLDDSQATNEPAEAETDGSQSNLSKFRVLTVAPEQIADASFSLQTMPNALASRRCRLRPKRRDITLPLASRFFRKLGSARYPPFVLLKIPSFSRFQPRYLARASNLLVPAFRSPGQAAGGFRSSPRPHPAAGGGRRARAPVRLTGLSSTDRSPGRARLLGCPVPGRQAAGAGGVVRFRDEWVDSGGR